MIISALELSTSVVPELLRNYYQVTTSFSSTSKVAGVALITLQLDNLTLATKLAAMNADCLWLKFLAQAFSPLSQWL